MSRRWRGAGMALLLLSGCMIGPDFRQPSAPVADRWSESGDPAVRTDRAELEAWWTAFDDPGLNELIDRACRQNLTLLAAGTRVLEARAALGVAIGELYPQTQGIGGNVGYYRASDVDPSSNPNNELGTYWRASLSSQIAWELDLWGKFRRGVESADYTFLASIATYDDVLVTLLSDVATTYIGIRTLQRQLEIASENVAKQQEALEIATARFHGGATSELDVYQAESALTQTQAAIPNLTAQLRKGQTALQLLLGEPPSSVEALLDSPGEIPVPAAEVAVGLPAELLRRRPDVRSAELKAAAQSAQIGMAKADLLPALAITGVFGTSAGSNASNHLSSLFTHGAIQFAFGPSFSWPILNYGQITNTVRVEDARLQTRLLEYKQAVLKAQKEVEDSLSGFLEGRRQVDLLRRSVAAANEALRVAMDQYTLGTRDFTTVLSAEQNLYVVQSQLATASGNVSTSLTEVYRSLGGGWQIRKANDFVDEATREEMRERTYWGSLLPASGEPPTTAPALPGPEDRDSSVQTPDW